MRNKPRRAGKRWLEGAPYYVLDCFDDRGEGDRYTILFGAEYITEHRGRWVVQFLGVDAYAQSYWGELAQHDAAGYRYSNGKRRVRWLDLPHNIRAHIIARANQD